MVSTLEDRIKVLSRDLARGWQKKLADYCGVSPPSVSDWASGQTATLDSAHLIKCSEFFKVNPHWLATGQGDRSINKSASSETIDARREFYAADISDLLKQIDNSDKLRRAYAAAVLAITAVRNEPK